MDLWVLWDILVVYFGISFILLDIVSDLWKVLVVVGVGDVDNVECVGVMMGGLNMWVSLSVGDMVKEVGI